MRAKRSDFTSQGKRTANERWTEEVEYQTSKILEAMQVIRARARVQNPAWSLSQVDQITKTIEDELQEIRDAYETTAPAKTFQFEAARES